MSRFIVALTTMVGVSYFAACCHTEDKPATDPSKVVVVCANSSADADQSSMDFDAGAPLEGQALTEKNVCNEACRALATVGCPESKTLPEGKDCATICRDIRQISSYDPYCVARAKTKEQVRKCPKVECK